MIESEPIMSSQSLSSVLSMFTDNIGQLRATSRLSMKLFLVSGCQRVSSLVVSAVSYHPTFLDREMLDRHDLVEVPRKVLKPAITINTEVHLEQTATFAECVHQTPVEVKTTFLPRNRR